MLGMATGGVGPGRRRLIRPGPRLLQAPSIKNDGSDPTWPTHGAGLLLVSGAANNNTHSSVEPAAASPFVRGDGAFGGTNYAAALFSAIAAAAGTVSTWSGANIPRVGWIFEHAAIDQVDAFALANSTSIQLPSLTALGMAANCFVGGVLMTRNAQTSIQTSALAVALQGLGFTIRGQRSTAPAYLVFDTDTTRLSAFAPAAANIDTTSGGAAGFVFSVKGTPQ